MPRLDELDLAKKVACPGCGEEQRMLGVPIGGSGLDLHFAKTSWCVRCTKGRVQWKLACMLAGLMVYP